MNILVTGSAGFIGFHLTLALLRKGNTVTGLDSLNDYYDPELKKSRLNLILESPEAANFTFIKENIADEEAVMKIFKENQFDIVINLAAQAGVRYSIENPHEYVDSNLVGFVNIIEGCRQSKIEHFIFASSSSVYGMNTKQPFSVKDRADYPVSLYAATKRSNELIAHAYSHLYQIPTTGLRFFTVYGPFGRPDMAYYKFTDAIINDRPIDVFNNGEMMRDFTYIDDIVEGLLRVIDKMPITAHNQYSSSNPPYKIYNIGNNNPVKLHDFIKSIENACGKIANINNLPMQPGDVPVTYAEIDDLISDVGFKPKTSIDDGIKKFVEWYIMFQNQNNAE